VIVALPVHAFLGEESRRIEEHSRSRRATHRHHVFIISEFLNEVVDYLLCQELERKMSAENKYTQKL
jgi:hypothetical protein